MKKDKPFVPIYLYMQECITTDSRLSCKDKFVIMLITALDNDRGCFATNSKLGYYLKLSESTISKSVNYLQELGYIVCNETKGGRSPIRKVREDLKLHKAGKSKSLPSHEKYTILPSEKDILIDKPYKEDIDLTIEERLKKEEKNYFSKKIQFSIEPYWKIYIDCKKMYEDRYAIIWSEDILKDLIDLYIKVLTAYADYMKNLRYKKKSIFIIRAFNIIITCKLRFFKDSNPRIFNKAFNSVIQNQVVEEKINKLKMRIGEKVSRF